MRIERRKNGGPRAGRIREELGDILVELGWRAPEGVGEISPVDNLTMLHASYHAHPENKGYPIAVRYLF